MNSAYCAGLFDGEGCIYISKDLVHITVSITQKETPILFLLQQEFGGKVTRYGKQNCHKWNIFSIETMLNFLQIIQPYAFIKANEINIAIEFLKGMRRKNKGCHPLSEEELDKRSTLRTQFYEDRKLHQNVA